MSRTRNNHFVPQWYQEGFFDDGRKNYRYHDLSPAVFSLPSGKSYTENCRFTSYPSQCFYQTDLYSTFFGEAINDEIEKRFFGPIDDWGSKAVKAFIGDDPGERRRHFERLFEYIDSQNYRTPKGLDWLRQHYPTLHQNELMREMQGIRMMNCTLWSQCVREIVSAEEADTKFIVSDHPVSIYNYASPPDHELCNYPNDPGVALKASQTVFPLNKDFCLILTNLEFAEDPDTVSPLEKRTFARNYRSTLINAGALIRSRKLNDIEVAGINLVIKSRARRYIAGGKEDWLFPEKVVTESWADLRHTLLPPELELFGFGGEMYIGYDDGQVRYQDKFGRSEEPREFLQKMSNESGLSANDLCGCGSGKKYKKCCRGKPAALRTTWSERSIRERNLILCRGIVNILGLDTGKDWLQIRRELTDDQIIRVYELYEALWPLETDILSMLPKPDGTARALYTGIIDPRLIPEFVVGSGLYFGEIMVQNPFLHPGAVNKDFSPVLHPKKYRHEFLKCVFLMMNLHPLIEEGTVNLFPDPCVFDLHLRDQMMSMAEARHGGNAAPELDRRTKWLMSEDFARSVHALPREARLAQIKQVLPDTTEEAAEELLAYQEHLRELDPLSSVTEDVFEGGEKGGLLNLFKMAPNFEISVYLARATGAFVFTDSIYRWRELLAAQHRHQGFALPAAPEFSSKLKNVEHAFVFNSNEVVALRREGTLDRYRALMQDLYTYAISTASGKRRQNLASQLASRLEAVHASSQASLRKGGRPMSSGRMHCIMPHGGLNHTNVSRMLVTSSVERHLANVPMAFYIETTNQEAYQRKLL